MSTAKPFVKVVVGVGNADAFATTLLLLFIVVLANIGEFLLLLFAKRREAGDELLLGDAGE